MALTEVRFIELFGAFEKRIDIRFERIETHLDKLEKQIKDLRSFQDHESKAIELDLQNIGNNKNISLEINYNTIGGKRLTRKNKVRK